MFFGSNFQDEYNENPLFCNYECSTKNVMQFLQLLPLLCKNFEVKFQNNLKHVHKIIRHFNPFPHLQSLMTLQLKHKFYISVFLVFLNSFSTL